MRLGPSAGGAFLLTVLPLWAGCGDPGGESAWAGERVDSGGVALVRNSGPGLWREGEAWRVEADLEIGGDEARPETLFGHVADLTVAEDGRIYVLDQQARTVRVFAPDGATVGDLGRPGEGPGEIGRFAFSVLVRGDTVLVADWSQARLGRFALDGTFLASERTPTTGAARSWWASFSSGIFFRSLERFTGDDGRWQGRDVLLRYAGEGVADTVTTFDYPHSDLGTRESLLVPLIVNTPSGRSSRTGGSRGPRWRARPSASTGRTARSGA